MRFFFYRLWGFFAKFIRFFILQLVARFGVRLARPERRSLIKFGGGGKKSRVHLTALGSPFLFPPPVLQTSSWGLFCLGARMGRNSCVPTHGSPQKSGTKKRKTRKFPLSCSHPPPKKKKTFPLPSGEANGIKKYFFHPKGFLGKPCLFCLKYSMVLLNFVLLLALSLSRAPKKEESDRQVVSPPVSSI